MVECNDPDPTLPTTLREHFGIMHPDICQKRQRYRMKPIIRKKKDLKIVETTEHIDEIILPAYAPGSMSDESILDKTGFKDEEAMLSYILVVCNGDINEMIKTTNSSRLTWFEEWLFFFDSVWGRSEHHWNTTTLERFKCGC